MDVDELFGDDIASLVDESDDDDDYGVGNDDDDDEEESCGAASALYDVVLLLLKQMPSNDFLKLIEVWMHLAKQSEKEAINVGSGCSGSGLDWHAIKVVNAVPVSQPYSVCTSHVLILAPHFFSTSG